MILAGHGVHPVCTTNAWSSRVNGSDCRPVGRGAWWIAMPVSRSAVRGTSPVISPGPWNRNNAVCLDGVESGILHGA